MLFPGTLKYVAAVAIAFLIGTAWCQEHWGTYDFMTGNRSCGTAPRAIKQWAGTHQERRPTERPDLEAWVARNRDSINAQYTAPCQTPLHLAAQFGRDDLAAVLLDAGADPNAPDKYGDRPLHLAAEYGHVLVVTLLIRRGARVDATGASDRTALHAAAEGLLGTADLEGRLQAATVLIARGANVNAQMRGNGFTPLWCATKSRSSAIADLLRASGGRDVEDRRVQ